jgi:hypothetical protein
MRLSREQRRREKRGEVQVTSEGTTSQKDKKEEDTP